MKTRLLTLSACAVSLFGQVKVTISSPASGEATAQIYQAQGTVSSSAAAIASVDISLDGGPYTAAALFSSPPSAWLSAIYSKSLAVGAHTVQVRATDAMKNVGSSQVVTFNVFHSNPACSHSAIGGGIYCERAASGVSTTTTSASVSFAGGYKAGQLIFVGVVAQVPPSVTPSGVYPWLPGYISNTAGYKWQFWGNVGSLSLDNDIVQTAIYYTVVPTTTSDSDTITVTHPQANQGLLILDSVVYSGTGAIEPTSASTRGWGGTVSSTNSADAASGPYSVTAGDLSIGFVVGAPTTPVAGWTERVEDITRPFTMVTDQIAKGTTAAPAWKMNVEGFVAIGIAFKPAALGTPTAVAILGVADSAVNVMSDTVAPGEYLSIYGTGLGPSAGVGMEADPSGAVTNSLGGTQVSFDGIPAPLIYASDGQTNVLVPYEIGASTQVNMLVSTEAGSSKTGPFQVVPAQPSVFTALNSDGSINSPANLASEGSLVSIFVNGAGALTPSLPSGTIATSPAPAPVLPVQVDFRYVVSSIPDPVADEQTVVPSYAGSIPGTVINMLRVDAKVPSGCAGACTLAVRVGSSNSPSFPLYVAADQ